jgi:hypothetical protein
LRVQSFKKKGGDYEIRLPGTEGGQCLTKLAKVSEAMGATITAQRKALRQTFV